MSPSTPSGWQQAMPALYGRILIILIAVLLAGYGLRIFRIDSQSLWFDEACSFDLAQRDLVSLTQATAADIHPPLYYYLLKGWIGLAGTSEFSLRYLSLIFGVLLVPVSYLVANRLLGKRAGLAATTLAAFSPFYVYYSQEARMYTLLGLFSQLAVYFFLRAMSTGRHWHWAGYTVFMVLALYSHLYAALTFAFLNLAFVCTAFTVALLGKSGRLGSGIRPYVLSLIAVVILYAPWLQVAFDKLANYTSPARGSPTDWIIEQTAIVFSLGHSVLGMWTFPGNPDYDPDFSLALALSLPLVAVAAYGSAVILLGRKTWSSTFSTPSALTFRSRAIFSSAYLLVPILLIILLSLGQRDFNARYLFVASPAYYLLMAAGMVALGRLWLGRWLMVFMALVFVAIWSYSLNNYYFVEKYSRDDHRSAVEFVRSRALPGDLVVLDASFDQVYMYYAGDTIPWIRLPESVPPDNQQTLSTLARTVPGFQRVWLIMWADYFLDPGRIVQHWLERNTFPIEGKAFHGPVIVYGYLTRSPIVEGPVQPSVPVNVDFADQLSLLGYDQKVEGGQSKQRVHLTFYWQARQRMTTNYSIFARFLNPAGQVFGLGDSQPVNGRLPTTVWKPGQIIRSELDVWTVPAAPPGDYRLVVGVYDQGTMRRLETSRGDAVEVGPIRLSERAIDKKGLDYQKADSIRYGDAIQLVGHRIDRPSGSLLRITLFWRAQQKLARRYTVFNHLVDSSGQIVAQKDGEPGGGAYPMDRWEPGQVVRDEYDIPLSDNLSGDYRLLTGLYDPETNERLAILDWWPFRKPATAYEIEKVHITP